MIRHTARLAASAIAASVFLLASLASAAAEILTAAEALQGVEDDKVILVDIRSPDEWRQTGIASIAVPLSMHEPGFVKGINRLQSENPDKIIALICAVGVRTAYMNELLLRRGFENIADVSEGMVGGRNGKGWIPSGMPLKKWQKQ